MTTTVGGSCAKRCSGRSCAVCTYKAVAATRPLHCTGTFTPTGNAARVTSRQPAQQQACSYCLITSTDGGEGSSNSRRRWGSPSISAANSGSPHAAQLGGWLSIRSSVYVWLSVTPVCPRCQLLRLPDRPRWLRLHRPAAGLTSPSLGGGFPLSALCGPAHRSRSSRRCRNLRSRG